LVGNYGEDIIIKGALSLILNISKKHPNINNRFTVDIDFYLKRKFSDFLESLKASKIFSLRGHSYEFTKIRTPKKNSAGRIEAVAEEIRILLDVQIDEYTEPNTVTMYGLEIAVTSPVSIVIDKLDSISKPKVIDRPKDLYDIYIVSPFYEFKYQEICSHHDFRITGDFETFIEEWEAIGKSYRNEEILVSLEKPDFNDLYVRVKEFASPFIVCNELITQESNWIPSIGVWSQIGMG